MRFRYGVLNDPYDDSLPSCSDCGAYVDDMQAHDRFHDMVDAILDSNSDVPDGFESKTVVQGASRADARS